VKKIVDDCAREFSEHSHGNSVFDKDIYFLLGEKEKEFVPFSYFTKRHPHIKSVNQLVAEGYVLSGAAFLELDEFDLWYQSQFNKKLTPKLKKDIFFLHHPDMKKVFEAVEIVDQVYRIMKEHKILINGKNLPVQLGEWYTKLVLGLKQVKSASQRGFDFETLDEKKVEVKVHWQDSTSPKGVKIKRSLIELSDFTTVVYISKDFTIRDILMLDSDYIIRKLADKGHTVFLKDSDVSSYFFSRSDKHYDKIVNYAALMKFSTPQFAMKVDERYQNFLKQKNK
jgi:hypothetical protein